MRSTFGRCVLLGSAVGVTLDSDFSFFMIGLHLVGNEDYPVLQFLEGSFFRISGGFFIVNCIPIDV